VISDIGNANGVYLFGIHVLEDERLLYTGSVQGQSMKGPYALMLDANGSPVSEFAPTGSIYPALDTPVTTIEGRVSGIQSGEKILLGGHFVGASFPLVNLYVMCIFGLDNSITVNDFNLQSKQVIVYPNPAVEKFRIDLAPGEVIESVELYDFSGRIIASWSRGTTVFSLPGNASAGLGLLRVVTDNRKFDTRIMIAR